MSQKRQKTLTESERRERIRKARRKLRAYLRLVMANLFWLGDLDDAIGGNVSRNIQKLSRRKVKKSTLTTKEKLLLSKPKEDRTEEEKAFLSRAIGGLKCFRRYPPEVKAQLAAVTYFIYVGPERFIVKQNQKPCAMYFLLSGEAAVKVRIFDKLFKEWNEEEHGTVGPGTMFGEVALIHGITRTATILTTTPCELLMIKKEDFDIVLKETVAQAWEEITKIMNRYSYFKNWDAVTKRECSIISRTRNYRNDEVILGDKIGLAFYSHLITSGSVSIVEAMPIVVYEVDGAKQYRLNLPNVDKSRSYRWRHRSHDKREVHFIRVCTLFEGAIFNIGERFDRRNFIADNPNTTCLLIPKYWLCKNNTDNIWNMVLQYYTANIPATDKIFKHWVKEKKFTKYRQKLVKSVMAQKKVSNTNCIHNVPYSIRLKESAEDYFDF